MNPKNLFYIFKIFTLTRKTNFKLFIFVKKIKIIIAPIKKIFLSKYKFLLIIHRPTFTMIYVHMLFIKFLVFYTVSNFLKHMNINPNKCSPINYKKEFIFEFIFDIGRELRLKLFSIISGFAFIYLENVVEFEFVLL